MKFDLHCHTTCSDGQLSPEALVQRAVEKGIDVLAITDHDVLAAYQAAKAHIDREALALTLLPGVEVSCKWHAFEIHVVGLGVNPEHPPLVAFLQGQRDSRDERALEIGRRLEKANIPNAYQGARAIAGTASISRSHYAQYLVQIGKANSVANVFKKYLARGKTGYVPSNWCSIEQACAAIVDAGGVPVLAHPGSYNMTARWLRELIQTFKAAGGIAMEVAQPQQSPTDRQQLALYCEQYGLLASAGSDFHYPSAWTELGRNLQLPMRCKPVWQHWPQWADISQ